MSNLNNKLSYQTKIEDELRQTDTPDQIKAIGTDSYPSIVKINQSLIKKSQY